MTSERDIAMAYRETIIKLAGNIRDADRLKRLYKLADFLCRKEIYEELYPETKAATGKELADKRWNATATVAVVRGKSFVADTAEKTGMAERTIRGKIQIAKGLTPEGGETGGTKI